MTEPVAPAGARGTSDWNRNGAIAGILAVALWVIGFLIIGDAANKDKGSEILNAYQTHENKILAGTIVFLIGTALFFFFLGALRNLLLAAEGPAGQLTAVAFAGGVATATMIALFPGADATGALEKKHLDASAANAIHKIGDAFFLAAEYLLPVLLVATALVALRTRMLPAWLAWLSLLIALVLLIAPIGWAALIFAFPVWVLIVSAVMLMGGRRASATAV